MFVLQIVLTGHLVKILRDLRKKCHVLKLGLLEFFIFYLNHVPTASDNVMQRMCKC